MVLHATKSSACWDIIMINRSRLYGIGSRFNRIGSGFNGIGSGFNGIGSRRYFYREDTADKPKSKTLSPWEEIHMFQPRVPHPHDYDWPKGAPDPLDTPRERFHEFMRGRPIPFTVSVGRNLYRNLGFTFFFVLSYGGYQAMRPDDFQWVDEERKRLAAAKKKLDRIKKHQDKQRRLLEAKAIDAGESCPETSQSETV